MGLAVGALKNFEACLLVLLQCCFLALAQQALHVFLDVLEQQVFNVLLLQFVLDCELLAGERTVGSKLRQEEVHDVRHRSVDLLTDRSEILDADLLRKSFNVGWTNLDLDLLGKSGVVFMEFLSDTLKQFLVASVIIYWLLFGRFGWFVFDDGFLSLLLALVELDDAEIVKGFSFLGYFWLVCWYHA